MEKKPYHHKDLKHALIEKGIELVGAEGLRGFSLRKVAAACGVSHAAPYSHFRNKEELLEAMQQHITEQFVNQLRDAAGDGPPGAERLLEMGKAYVLFFLHHPDYIAFMQSYSAIRIDLSPDGDDEDNYQPFAMLRSTVFSMLENSGLSRETKNDFVIALWANVHGLASIAAMKNVRYGEDWEQKIVDILKAPTRILGGRT